MRVLNPKRGAAVLALSLFLSLSLIGLAGTAQAHAIIRSSVPADKAEVAGPELDVLIRFNSLIDHQRSRLSLTAPASASGGGAPTPIAFGDTPGDGLSAHLGDLAPGAYKLRWQVLSVDGHITRGDIHFTVKGR